MRVAVWLAALAVFVLASPGLAGGDSPPPPPLPDPVATFADLLPNIGCLVGFSTDNDRMIVAMDTLKEVCFTADLGNGVTYYGKTAKSSTTETFISSLTDRDGRQCEKSGEEVCYCSNSVSGGTYVHMQCEGNARPYCPKYCNVPEVPDTFKNLQEMGIYTVDGCLTDSMNGDGITQQCFDEKGFKPDSDTTARKPFTEIKAELLTQNYKVVRFEDGVCPLVLGWNPASDDAWSGAPIGDLLNQEYEKQVVEVSCSKTDGACFSKFSKGKLLAGCKQPVQPTDPPKNDAHCYIDKRDRKFQIAKLELNAKLEDDCECPVTTNATTSCLKLAPTLKTMTNKIIPASTSSSQLCRVGYQDPTETPTKEKPAMLAKYNPSQKVCRAVRSDTAASMYFGIEDKCPGNIDEGTNCQSDYRDSKLDKSQSGMVQECNFPTTNDCYCSDKENCNTPTLPITYTTEKYEEATKEGSLAANGYVDEAEDSPIYVKDESNVENATECYNVAAMRIKGVALYLNSDKANKMPTVKCNFTMEECFAVFHKKVQSVESFISLGCRPQEKNSQGDRIPNDSPFASGKIPHPIEFKQAGVQGFDNPSNLPTTYSYSCISHKCNMDFSNTRIHDGATFWCHDDIVAKGKDPRRVLLCDSCGVDRRDNKFDFYYCIIEHKKWRATDQSKEDIWTKNSMNVVPSARECKDLTAKSFCLCTDHFCTVTAPIGMDQRAISSSKPAKSHLNEYTDGHVCFAAGAWAPNVGYSNNTANFIPCNKDERCYLTYAFYDVSLDQQFSKDIKISINTFAAYSGNTAYDKNGNTKVYFKMGCASRLNKGGGMWESALMENNEFDAVNGVGFTRLGQCPSYAFIPADSYTWHSKPSDETRKPQSGTCFCQPTKYNATSTYKPCNFPDEEYFNTYFTTKYPPTLPDFNDVFTASSGVGAPKNPQMKFAMPRESAQCGLFTVASLITTLIVALLM